ncbi:MAG: hypothetical protein WCP69_08505 [Bacteroidota bacterium]
MKTGKVFIAMCSIILMILTNSFSQNCKSFNIDIDPQSSISINGTSNVNSFLFEQKGVLVNNPISISFTDSPKYDLVKPITLPIEVKRFECDNKLMKTDFFKTLNVDNYPFLDITMTNLELPANFNLKSKTTNGSVRVSIKLAGVVCKYKVPFIIAAKNEKLVIFGEKVVSFSDFNLEPPSKLLGIVKVDNNLRININLIVRYTQNQLNTEYTQK